MKTHLTKITDLLIRTGSRARKSSQTEMDVKIAKGLMEWIDSKSFCRNNESISDVAEAIGVSSEALSYYCNHVLRMHFASFRKILRLKEAKELIRKNPYASIISIAYSVGIYDKCNFRRQFYEEFGIPPSEWRRKCRKIYELKLH